MSERRYPCEWLTNRVFVSKTHINVSKTGFFMINSELATAHTQGLFLARMCKKKCTNNAKNVFYNVNIMAKSDVSLLLVDSNVALRSI